MQVPIISGIYTDENADFRTSYPVNYIPVPKVQGVSQGYLRPADGIVEFATGPGVDRGGINWNGICYRVMGSRFVKVAEDGTVTDLGFIGGADSPVSMDYSFDKLAIAVDKKLFYWDGSALLQVTDIDLGDVLDVIWIDGYFMTTDGISLVVTELPDPTSVNPLKYGSSEADPDSIVALKKIRTEVFAVNRYTIEVFDNVGGELFPFQRIKGAQMTKGAIGVQACCIFDDALAFVGSGKKEALGIHLGANAGTAKISTREVDQLLAALTEDEQKAVVLESRVDKGHRFLLLHLPDRTLVFDAGASEALKQHVWFVLTSALTGWAQYRARFLTYCYNKWISGDPTSFKLGYYVSNISTHYGSDILWEFGTAIIYNEGSDGIIHELELVCLTGRVALGKDPRISTSYSVDGETWSVDKSIRAGKRGERTKRLVWLQQGLLGHWRLQRFRGDSQAFLSVARLEAVVEALNV